MSHINILSLGPGLVGSYGLLVREKTVDVAEIARLRATRHRQCTIARGVPRQLDPDGCRGQQGGLIDIIEMRGLHNYLWQRRWAHRLDPREPATRVPVSAVDALRQAPPCARAIECDLDDNPGKPSVGLNHVPLWALGARVTRQTAEEGSRRQLPP